MTTAQNKANLGIVMLVHKDLAQAQTLIRHWHDAGCPVVVHVDKIVTQSAYRDFQAALKDLPQVSFSKRFRCEWGMWGLVAATQAAARHMLESYHDVNHVYLASGACIPLRSVSELQSYLETQPDTDFIESARVADVPWTIGGLSQERFTLRFPFSWRKHRVIFDRYVALQRKMGFTRKIPKGLDPHIGSQWWCLTRATLDKILKDPQRSALNRYFTKSWIPDESYFQTLVRRHSTSIHGRSLTLAKFDHQGKPHIFYDDHLPLLRRSDCFVARKIWPQATRLYDAFLADGHSEEAMREPKPEKIDRLFAQAVDTRVQGRAGLKMQSRFARTDKDRRMTAEPYTVLQGFDSLFVDFESWLSARTSARVHGHLFASHKVEYEGGDGAFLGNLSDSAPLRDYNPRMFLSNFIWNTRGRHQCFQFSPDDQQKIALELAYDDNARLFIISGAWILPLLSSRLPFEDIRARAALLQKNEAKFLNLLKSSHVRARLHVWSLAQALEAPQDVLSQLLGDLPLRASALDDALPDMRDADGIEELLTSLQNAGMSPYILGVFLKNKQISQVIGTTYGAKYR